ncbi:MAG: hypothetical protein P0Y62_17590 [Candidatus Chryseobacterium colombiense]|nr:hypothetical protein [Chryseobacterium sp.]WEK69617.1 MAG: hypothetical protein P0Y62_17590 [Chryseobacterium sp.]
MNLDFNDTFYYISLIVIGAPVIYFLTKSGFSYREEKKTVLMSLFLTPILVLLLMSVIFGIDKTTKNIGDLFGDFLHFIIYIVIGLIFLGICLVILVFLIADNKKDVINSIKDRILKIGKGIGRKNK